MFEQQLALKKTYTLNLRLMEIYFTVRQETLKICSPLENEDYVIQPSPEVSPPKWHLGHTSWFFEEFLLIPFLPGYKRLNNSYSVIFNSYYKSAGDHWQQNERGQLSRPTVDDVYRYREHVDKHMLLLFSLNDSDKFQSLVEVGLNHEQQHQELLFMDIKYILGHNPQLPSYSKAPLDKQNYPPNRWCLIDEGIYEIGHSENFFAYDNEKPKHETLILPFAIQGHFVTNNEYSHFIEDEGYKNPLLWLSKGWDWVNENKITNPLYWINRDNQWFEYTLHGTQSLDPYAPVCHISFYEAHAFANWYGVRLPTEQEYEVFLNYYTPDIQLKPKQLHCGHGINDLWAWTTSHYSPYPRYKPYNGRLSEYNSKFMCNQFVLKGGSFATSSGHLRNTYRNFYEPQFRWMFSGIRLAKDI